ncbi:E3 ubiquitin-protein ligase RNF123-like isoform X4 [Ptychodera flava]|uniref:E3 ubiquitin-protein ligase RNF123-like isoform X3 n=1 Tax=Ptychodera flava TaxID=63121 RepID=UPI00396A3390
MAQKNPGGTSGGDGIDSLLLQGASAAIAGAIRRPGTSIDANEEEFSKFLNHIFECQVTDKDKKKPLGLYNLNEHLDSLVLDIKQPKSPTKLTSKLPGAKSKSSSSTIPGRIGSDKVHFDSENYIGGFMTGQEKLVLASQSNFSTAKANVCLYKGKWVYEVMLGSKGVMQLGWCTLKCKFHQEVGVGDTENSYSYDGNRIRKWNVATCKYGEAWQTGDVISCMIDLDKGTVSFARNGKNLGTAYNNIKVGPNYAYFPAVSLSFNENVQANFGATPLRYPVDGYRPIQEAPKDDLGKMNIWIDCLERVLPSLLETKMSTNVKLVSDQARKSYSYKLLVCAHVFEKMAPLLSVPYIVDAVLIKFMLKLCDNRVPLGDQPLVTKMLDVMWMFMEEHELKKTLEQFAAILITKYRFSPVSKDMKFQAMYLTLFLAVVRHEKTRKHLLKHVLFDKVRFPFMMMTKPPDDTVLAEIIPTVYWKDDKSEKIPDSEKTKKEMYDKHCKTLQDCVGVLEEIQVEILKILLDNSDNAKGPSTRFIFIGKFRHFLKEHAFLQPAIVQCPLPVTLCFFHRLVVALRYYWDKYAETHPGAVTNEDAHIPAHAFYDNTIDFFTLNRVGGVSSHLDKELKEELQKVGIKRNSNDVKDQGFASVKVTTKGKDTGASKSKDQGFLSVEGESEDKDIGASKCKEQPSATSLIEILDGLIMLYDIGVHKQLGKMAALYENASEFAAALKDTEEKLKKCPQENKEVYSELQHAFNTFHDKTSEHARHVAWVATIVYPKPKQDNIFWLLKSVLKSIDGAHATDKLFAYLPEYYIDTAVNAYNALKNYFSLVNPMSELQGSKDVVIKYGIFLSRHFGDDRIKKSDMKDIVIQAMMWFVANKDTLTALENMPKEDQLAMVKSLLAPYESRAWAQTNWILVRVWKGCGFGFRYVKPPHLQSPKATDKEKEGTILQRPCPSIMFQDLIREVLLEDDNFTTHFLNTVLNQLNWAFSEFIGMLQEISHLSTKPEPHYVDSRQLKLCGTCFDLTVGLTRVLEFVTAKVPELFLDWSRPSAESILCRLFQLLTQVLNRVTARYNVFENVVRVDLPGMDSVDHFPILAAVAGILTNLMCHRDDKLRECASSAILADPNFQISTVEFLLDGDGPAAATIRGQRRFDNNFSFRKYDEVGPEEITMLAEMISHLKAQQTVAPPPPQTPADEEICPICYARPLTKVFQPCGHKSCKSCITQHLMNNKSCFFCKAEIKDVEDIPPKLFP